MAHASLRCVLREICEICVKLNHLCELFLVRLPWLIAAGWHTQALARVIREIREIRVKFNYLCESILMRQPCS